MVFDHDFESYPELTNSQLETLRFLSPHPQLEEDFEATVMKVHDGDTVTLSTSTRDFLFPLRLHDIDAPELNAGGEEAGTYLRERIIGKNILVLLNNKNRVDKYGRLLGKIICDGFDVGEEMLRLGLVVPFGKKNEGGVPEINKILRPNQWF